MLAPVLYVLSHYASLMLADDVVKTYIAAAKNCIKHYFLLLKIRTLKSPLEKFYLKGFDIKPMSYFDFSEEESLFYRNLTLLLSKKYNMVTNIGNHNALLNYLIPYGNGSFLMIGNIVEKQNNLQVENGENNSEYFEGIFMPRLIVIMSRFKSEVMDTYLPVVVTLSISYSATKLVSSSVKPSSFDWLSNQSKYVLDKNKERLLIIQ